MNRRHFYFIYTGGGGPEIPRLYLMGVVVANKSKLTSFPEKNYPYHSCVLFNPSMVVLTRVFVVDKQIVVNTIIR